MTAPDRPWWASEVPPGQRGADPDPDPVDAHRAARRGTAPPDGSTGGADDPAEDEAEGRYGAGDAPPSGEDGSPTPGAHGPDICGICPICVTARILDGSRPELLEHLTEAVRHLAAAVRVAVEPPSASPPSGEDPAPDRSGDPRRVRRIDLD